MTNFVKKFWNDQSGAAAAEYALILAIVGIPGQLDRQRADEGWQQDRRNQLLILRLADRVYPRSAIFPAWDGL